MRGFVTCLALPLVVAFTASLAAAAGASQEESAAARFEQGVEAYRRGDYESATTLWRRLLEEGAGDVDRAVLLYDLGNAAFRRDRPLEAAGWYTAALRLDPRSSDAWANLELARERARLDPADRGDLIDTLRRLVTALTLAEAEWVVLVLALALLAALVAEALLGGMALRRVALVLAALAVVACVPWLWRLSEVGRTPLFVVEAGGATLRSEPRADAAAVGQAVPADQVELMDALPGWVRVRARGGERGWVLESELLELTPGGGRL